MMFVFMSDSVFEGDMNRVAKGFANLFADIST